MKLDVDSIKGLYIAHRGIHNLENGIIENTLPAFSMALDKSVPIEFDVRILKDGNLIVFHDDNLKRLMDIDKRLSDITYDELKKIVFPNTNFHVPLFNDVLNLINGKVLLVIEIKTCDNFNYKEYCRKILSVLENYSGDFIIKSFDFRIVNWFLKNTSYTTGLLLADVKNLITDFFKDYRVLKLITRPDFLSVDYRIIDRNFVQNFRKKKPVLVWTIRNQKVLDKCINKADSYLIEKFYF